MGANVVNEVNLNLEEEEQDDITFHPDSINLTGIFPAEVWEIVTQSLVRRSPSELESLANSSPFFQQQVAPHRTTYLFEKAFQSTSLNLWKKDGLKCLPLKDVLKCRGICSQWNLAVDKLMSEKFQYVKSDVGSIVCFQASVDETFQKVVRNEFLYRRPAIGRTLAVLKFIQCFQDTHSSNTRNPFIGTNVSIRYPLITQDDEINQQRYLDGISTMLNKYGSHIQQLTLTIDNSVHYFANLQRVRQSFLRLPNLKKLQLFCDVTGTGPRGPIPCIVENLFPKWTHLESLSISKLPNILFTQLLRRNNHISTFIIKKWEVNCNFFTFYLPNLRNLEIGSDSVTLIEKLSSEEVQWPLEHLKIDLGYELYAESVSLFRVIQDKFANTLVSLNLSVNVPNFGNERMIFDGPENFRLYLPKLKKIELFVNEVQVCLDFLLPMRESLEEIRVVEGYKLPFPGGNITPTNGDIVQFSGFEWKMMESNIWAIFKKMWKIEVVTNSYTAQTTRCYFRKDLVKKDYLYNI